MLTPLPGIIYFLDLLYLSLVAHSYELYLFLYISWNGLCKHATDKEDGLGGTIFYMDVIQQPK